MRFASPILSDHENIDIQFPAPGHIFKLVVGAHNIDTPQSFQHFYALSEGNNWDIGLIKVYNLIGSHANRNGITQRFAVIQQSEVTNMQQIKCANSINDHNLNLSLSL